MTIVMIMTSLRWGSSDVINKIRIACENTVNVSVFTCIKPVKSTTCIMTVAFLTVIKGTGIRRVPLSLVSCVEETDFT